MEPIVLVSGDVVSLDHGRMESADLEAQAAEMKEDSGKQSKDLMHDHLANHLEQNPNSTYETLVAVLHPENARVELDSRTWISGSAWLDVWDEMAVRGSTCWPRRATDDGSQDEWSAKGGLIDLSVGALLIGIVALTTIIYVGVGCCLLELAWLWGALARRMPRTFEPLPRSSPTDTVLPAPLLIQTLLQLLFLGIAGLLQLVGVLFAWILAFLQLVFMFVGGALMLVAVIFREVIAVVGLLLCGVLALSPTQGWSTCKQIRKVARTTHAAMCSCVRRCIVASEERLPAVGGSMRSKIQASLHKLRSANTESSTEAFESGAASGLPRTPLSQRMRNLAERCRVAMRTASGSSPPASDPLLFTSGQIVESSPTDLVAAEHVQEHQTVESTNPWVAQVRGWASKAFLLLRSVRTTPLCSYSVQQIVHAVRNPRQPQATSEANPEENSADAVQVPASNGNVLLAHASSLASMVTSLASFACAGDVADAAPQFPSCHTQRVQPLLDEEASVLQSSSSGQVAPVPTAKSNTGLPADEEQVAHVASMEHSAGPVSPCLEAHDEWTVVTVDGSEEDTLTEGPASSTESKKNAKRPTRRGGQWKKQRKHDQQGQSTISDLPDTDDGWSD